MADFAESVRAAGAADIADAAGSAAADAGSARAGASAVGVWEVVIAGAPFPYHVMTFHADGTLLQSNPDLGNRSTSDSDGMGAWCADGASVTAAFLEFTVDRADPALIRKGIVRFELTLAGDEFSGSATATFYELDGTPYDGPHTARVSGRRFDLGPVGP